MTASPKGRIVFASEMKVSAALNASAPAFGPSYRGFTIQGTPSPPPKTHRKKILKSFKTIKLYPNQIKGQQNSLDHASQKEPFHESK